MSGMDPTARAMLLQSDCPTSSRPLHRHSWRPIINIGLPRTGTTSFSIASALIGMRTASGCENGGNYWRVGRDFAGPCLYEGTAAGQCGVDKLRKSGIEASLLPGDSSTFGAHAGAASFDSHSDSPWFMLDIARLRAAYPGAKFVCTTRSAESWIRSVVDFQNRTTFMPGGLVFMYHVKAMLGMRRLPGRPGLGTHGRPHIPDTNALLRYHEWHHENSCAGLPLLRLEDSSEGKWKTFCAAMPSKWTSRCRATSVRLDWPAALSTANVSAYRPSAFKSA